MKILISGSSGMVGSALVPHLAKRRHEVWRLVRPESGQQDSRCIVWDPKAGALEAQKLEGFDAVIHLGGLNLASRRWNEEFKKQLVSSRVESTGLLAGALAGLKSRPAAFLCASAVGIYGDRGEDALDESAPVGTDFLADLCRQWEAACEPARAAGIRVVNARFGVILSGTGGVLKKMLLPFKLGLGGPVGSGKQVISWIALPDLLLAITHLLERQESQGAYNLTSPNPVSNRNFTRALGRALGRPAFIPLPAVLAKLVLGEMAQALLLASQKAMPKRLKSEGFKYELPYLGEALGRVLK